MKKQDHSYFQNRECEYFPCHKGVGETFNCLFCYCPLYTLAERCGGHFSYTPDGIKDCSGCLIPHSDGGYDHVLSRFQEIAALAKRKEG